MIRINLLPYRIARKKENIRRQISVFFLLILMTALALVYTTQLINKKIERVIAQTKTVESQIVLYKEKSDRVKQIKRDLALLEEKLKIVDSLEAQREKQLILFDTMTDLIVPGRMWLESLKTNQQSVSIKGIAFDNPTIADFMRKLEASDLFDSVDLKTAMIKKVNDEITLKSFELQCKKAVPVANQENGGAKK